MEIFETDEIICRTCLSNDIGEYTNLSHGIEQDIDVNDDTPKILDCLHFCLHSESPVETKLPQFICNECLSKLKCSFEFIKMAKQSEAKLTGQQIERESIETALDEAGSIVTEYNNGDEELILEDEYTCNLQFNVNDETRVFSFEEIDEDEKEIEINLEKPSIQNAVLEATISEPTCEINEQTNNCKMLRLLPHQCEHCSFETNSSFNLRRHYIGKHKIYPNAQQLKRREPGYFETSEKNLLLCSKAPPALHQCEICKKVFQTEYLLNCHLNKHKGLNPYKCQKCSYECRYLSNIRRHYKLKHAVVPTSEMLKPSTANQPTDSDITLSCTKCNFLGATNDELNSHLSREHEINEKTSLIGAAKPYNPYIYMCSKCSKKFKMLHVLKTHELTCSTKSVSNGFKGDLANKPYKCSECSSRFVIPEYLQTHRAAVHRARIHQCHICEKSFKLPSQLKSHVARHTASRAYKCDQCVRSYVSQSELNVHRRVHTGELPYNCNICSQRFQNADRLTVHKNKNHLHAKFKCSHCSEEFETKAKLQLHRYKHTSMPYNCIVCLKEFDKRHHIRRHMTSVHHTQITEEQLAAMFAKNMKRNNRYDVFKLSSLLNDNSRINYLKLSQ